MDGATRGKGIETTSQNGVGDANAIVGGWEEERTGEGGEN